LILETSLVGGVDLNSYNRFTYDLSGIGYFTTGYAIYRIMLPEVTSIHSPKQPPLPLSIGTPYPHPVSKDAGSATLFIQSDKLAEVNMTVHNLAGRGLRVLYTGELGADGRYVTWDIRGIAPGTYLLQLGSKKGVCRRKVVVE
ncbi:MAG: T9SS type A sorting domain-containing protein, partial [Bacteroidetes bacterium]|nr:T9SS type A sorting domain-containing protein [Bacteroidota bacterium]